jgi:monoamine oxidase
MAHTPLFRTFKRILQKAQRENLKVEGSSLPSPQRSQWTRRRLIKSAVLAGGAALTTNLVSHLKPVLASSNPRIAVIGGGIAGLNAAFQLKKAGLRATIYEARSRLGGRILSTRNALNNNLVLDLGGSFINTDHEDMLELAREFRLRLFNRADDAERFSFPDVGYFFDGSIRSEAEIADKLRPLARQIFNDANLVDEDFDRSAPRFDRISVAEYLDRHNNKIPDPFIRVLIETTIRTEYGVEPNESSTLQLFFNLPTVDGDDVEILASDEVFVVEGGSGRMIEKLEGALARQIQTRMRLTKIQSQGSRFRLTFANNRQVEADYVIMAIPFTVLRSVNIQVILPGTLRRFINQGNLGRNEKLVAGFDKKVWRQDEGFVKEIYTDLGFAEAWDETQRQENRQDGALTFYFGGDEVRTIQSDSTASQGRKIVNQFERAIPGAKAASTNRFLRTDWTRDPLTKGGYSTFKPGQLTEFGELLYIESDDPEERQDVNVENLVFAGEHLSDEFYGFMNGAAQTGRLAAQVVLRSLQGG